MVELYNDLVHCMFNIKCFNKPSDYSTCSQKLMMNTYNISGNKDEGEQTSLAFNSAYKRILASKLELIQDVEVVYTPQSFAALTKLTGMYSALQAELNDVALSKIEGLIALYLALSEVSSAKGFSAVLTLYAKTHSQTSLVSQLKSIADALFDDLAPQASSENSNDKEARPEWLSHMLTGLTDWKLLISSPGFKKISRVLTLMVTLGVIDSKQYTLGNFELFAGRAMDKHVSAVDLIDALMETTVFFAEGAYQCFLQGSIRPIFFSSSEVVKMEQAYLQKVKEYEYARNGNLEKFEGKSEAQFGKELSALIEKLAELYKTMPPGTEKKIIQTKWEALTKMDAEFAALKVKGGLRHAPFAVKIFAASGQGKSTFADLAMTTVLKANNKPASSEYIVTLNDKDKHMNGYRTFITGIKIDDYGNTKSQFWETSPSDWIIKICNNIRETAVMADIANKGKISIEPACLTITTNNEDLHAGITSYCPASVLRRAHVHVEIRSKPEVSTNGMLDSDKVEKVHGDVAKINDIWEIDVKQPIFEGNDFNSWKIIKKSIGIDEFLDYLVVESRKHFSHQNTIVNSFKEPEQLVDICAECSKLTNTCTCEVEPHFGDRIADTIKTKADSIRVRANFHSNVLQTKAEDFTVKYLLKMINKLEDSPYSSWTNWIPTQFLDNDYVKGAILYAGADYIEESVVSYVRKYTLMSLLVMSLTYMMSTKLTVLAGLVLFVFFLFYYACVVEAKKDAYFKAIVEQNGSLHAAFMSARDKHVHYACGIFASLAVLYGVVQVVKALRKSMGVQGSLRPRSVEEVKARDAEADPWGRSAAPVKVESEKSFVNASQSKNALSSLLGQMVVDGKFTACFMLKTNNVIIPKHFLPKETMKAEIFYCKRKISFLLNPTLVSPVGDADMVTIYVPNTGPLKDARPYFCEQYSSHPLTCRMIGLTPDREIFEDVLTWNQVPEVNNGFMPFPGSHYRLGHNKTFAGMCMSIIYRDSHRSSIVGFHLGGVTGSDRGCGATALRSAVDASAEALEKMNDTFMSGPQASEIKEQIFGKDFVVGSGVDPKSPAQYIDSEDAAVLVYGTVKGRNTYHSNVIETPISKAVEEVTGVSNKWGAPKFKKPIMRADGSIDNQTYRPWFESLDVCSKPSIGFDPAHVQDAMDDYMTGIEEVFYGMEAMWKEEIRPLSRLEVVSGIDGKRFIDSMNSSTSMGYYTKGKKSEYLIDLPPTADHACPRTFTPEVWESYEEAMSHLDQGEYANLIFNSALKDEATRLDKDKVRVFQAAKVELQIGIRTYFLPVARFLSANPLVAECAVGINSHGPEWHEMSEFMAEHGIDRIIAGDYSKYDLRMAQQLVIAAMRIMIKIAQMSGNYSQKEIKRMEGLAFEVCSPLVAFNGTLMRFLGTNPSGHNMTVYVNSIVNSLLHRLAFNDVYDAERRAQLGKDMGLNRPLRFRDVVSLMTYGDDARGSVMDGFDDFNHISMANFLAKNDMKFTMPDKESTPVKFMNRYEADFLKRKDAFNPDLGVMVGQLDEDSIFKSLHSIMKSKVVGPLEVSRMNMEGALREWFFYGRKHYDMRREQIQKIARKVGVVSDDFELTYDERVEMWKQKYEPQSGELPCPGVTDMMNPRHVIYKGEKANKNLRYTVVEVSAWSDDKLREKYVYSKALGTAGSRVYCKAIELIQEFRGTIPLDVWEMSYPSLSTMEETEGVRTEEELMEDVKSVLGAPLAEEYVIIHDSFGKGDLLYVSGTTFLVIECKRVVGRHPSFAEKVVKQALRYGRVIKTLWPKYTVYSMTFTEHGFEVVDVQGDITFPERFADVLDIAKIHWA